MAKVSALGFLPDSTLDLGKAVFSIFDYKN